MPIISIVGLFCCGKFEETPNEKVSKLSNLSKSYFNSNDFWEPLIEDHSYLNNLSLISTEIGC